MALSFTFSPIYIVMVNEARREKKENEEESQRESPNVRRRTRRPLSPKLNKNTYTMPINALVSLLPTLSPSNLPCIYMQQFFLTTYTTHELPNFSSYSVRIA